MSTQPQDRIVEILAGLRADGTFAARRTAGADDLRLTVTGAGPIAFPVSGVQAQQLRTVAQIARFGRGEETLVDTAVRNTWEIPAHAVRVDERRWHNTLLPTVDALRRDLGLPDHRRLVPEFHSMLLYDEGHFFLPHRDSEKCDDMVATLVVTLPSAYRGGEFIVEHGGERITYGRTPEPLSFVAFYADCRHEVRPVTAGFRVVLTYNLLLERTVEAPRIGPALWLARDPLAVRALADGLTEYFATAVPRSPWATQAEARVVPDRLVYLLDHEYTERGLAWDRLKGTDADRAGALAAAAVLADCEAAVALADVHEVWSAHEDEDDYGFGYRRGRYDEDEYDEDEYDEDFDEDFDKDDDAATEPGAGAVADHADLLAELQDTDTTLTHWIPAGERRRAPSRNPCCRSGGPPRRAPGAAASWGRS